jgi:hypothetical protein
MRPIKCHFAAILPRFCHDLDAQFAAPLPQQPFYVCRDSAAHLTERLTKSLPGSLTEMLAETLTHI